MSHHFRAVGAVLAVLAVLASTATAGPASAELVGTTVVGTDSPTSHVVTLITGDQVRLSRIGDRCEQVQVQPALGRLVPYLTSFSPEQCYVIPMDAAPLVEQGLLDSRLFDVAGLVEHGYDDRHRTDLPLIVEYADGRLAARSAGPAGAEVTQRMRGLDLVAVAAEKSEAAQFWAAVTRGPRTLSAGVEQVWLDAPVRAALDRSVPQVGAPAAWDAGLTGAGVTVAVLDTGYDQQHPDLAGRVSVSENFSTAEDIQDRNGHGTHVASIVAGSGAASGGQYRGVAPDTTLAIGRVLDDEGFGTESDVIAGLEWAAADVGAEIVNLSLGGWESGGTDPVSQTVNALAAEHGTLFVAAAGNLGLFGPQSVSSPGAATAALTVGSVDPDDRVSEFSGQGPRLGDRALKPELVAPGDAIVAARAEGTEIGEPVGEAYTRLPGTSMAAPHVAGAAAILAQQHPEWSGEQLKAALVGSATPAGGGTVYEQGAGRLDVARAIQQPVTAAPAVADFATLRWPHTGTRTATVTYRNDSPAPVTLTLALEITGADGEPIPAGALSAPTGITVPANGTATASLELDTTTAPIGQFGGWLTAGTADGAIAVRTPVGGYIEPESYDLAVGLLDRAGRPAQGEFDEVVFMSADRDFDWVTARHGDTVRLQAGDYYTFAVALTPRPGEHEPSVTMFARPRLAVRADGALTLDARDAEPAGVRVDRDNARHTHLTVAGDFRFGGYALNLPETYPQLYLDGFQETAPGYLFSLRERLLATDARLVATQPERFEVPVWWAPSSPKPDGTMDVGMVDGGAGRAEDLAGVDAAGKAVLVTPADEDDIGEAAEVVTAAGGRAVVLRLRPGVSVNAPEQQMALPVFYTTRAVADRLTGTSKVRLTGMRNSPYAYELAMPLSGEPSASPRVHDRDLAMVDAHYPVPADPVQLGYPHPEAWLGDFVLNVAGFCCDEIVLPHRRVEYYSPGPISWTGSYNFGGDSEDEYDVHHLGSGLRQLHAGERRSETWAGPVFGPGLADPTGLNPPWAVRDSDTVRLAVPLLADGHGHVNWPEIDQVESATGGTTLYRNGDLVGSTDQPGNGVFTVPPGPAELRVVAEFQRTGRSWWPLSTAVHVAWQVRSTGDGLLPLLAVRYQPYVGRRLLIEVETQAGAPASPVHELTVQVSYDDGTTWQPAKVRPRGDAWMARLPAAPADGFVSLRAYAADTAGNSVEQTIIRAYQRAA